MGVYIKEMQMPEGCRDCELLQNDDGCMYCGWNNYLIFGNEEFVPDYRMNGCPLIEVAVPHGRLIDKDYLSEHIEDLDSNGWNNAFGIPVEYLESAPTVIESEDE